jgi:hypothetical protein
MRLLDGIAIRLKSSASAVYFIEESKYNTHIARMAQEHQVI